MPGRQQSMCRRPPISDIGGAIFEWWCAFQSVGRIVLRFPEREGRIRSAERTEVHLAVTTWFTNLLSARSMRTSGA
jgi:hypothetical protein